MANKGGQVVSFDLTSFPIRLISLELSPNVYLSNMVVRVLELE